MTYKSKLETIEEASEAIKHHTIRHGRPYLYIFSPLSWLAPVLVACFSYNDSAQNLVWTTSFVKIAIWLAPLTMLLQIALQYWILKTHQHLWRPWKEYYTKPKIYFYLIVFSMFVSGWLYPIALIQSAAVVSHAFINEPQTEIRKINRITQGDKGRCIYFDEKNLLVSLLTPICYLERRYVKTLESGDNVVLFGNGSKLAFTLVHLSKSNLEPSVNEAISH